MNYDYHQSNVDDYLDEYFDDQAKRRRHARLMRLPPGHPDEPETPDEEDGDGSV